MVYKGRTGACRDVEHLHCRKIRWLGSGGRHVWRKGISTEPIYKLALLIVERRAEAFEVS